MVRDWRVETKTVWREEVGCPAARRRCEWVTRGDLSSAFAASYGVTSIVSRGNRREETFKDEFPSDPG